MADKRITFGEFVALAKSRGIKDDTELDWVDFHGIDDISFNTYDNGSRATICGKINFNVEPAKPSKLKRKLT